MTTPHLRLELSIYGNQMTYLKLAAAQTLPIDDADNQTQQKVY
jgi:hypothetical protein